MRWTPSQPAPLERLRPWVLKRDDHTCQVAAAFDGQDHGDDLHVDHIWPRFLGGRDELINLWTLCAGCNLSKGAQHPMDWVSGGGGYPAMSVRVIDRPVNKFWLHISNACYQAEALGLWVEPDLSLWRLEDV